MAGVSLATGVSAIDSINLSTANITGVLPGVNGGTGAANTGKVITLANNLTTIGNFAMTLTATAVSNATLPAGTKTLAATDGTGASGTWGINVSGSAATATSATTATNIAAGAAGSIPVQTGAGATAFIAGDATTTKALFSTGASTAPAYRILANADLPAGSQSSSGAWTPTDGSSDSLTFATAVGYYNKIGNIVQIQATVVYPVTAGVAPAKVASLPFATKNTTDLYFNSVITGTANIAGLQSTVVPGTTTMEIRNQNNSATQNVALSGTALVFSGTYTV